MMGIALSCIAVVIAFSALIMTPELLQLTAFGFTLIVLGYLVTNHHGI